MPKFGSTDYKDTITKSERLQIIGLMALARKYGKMMEDCEKEINNIVGCKEETGSHFGDIIFDTGEVDSLLRRIGIKVV